MNLAAVMFRIAADVKRISGRCAPQNAILSFPKRLPGKDFHSPYEAVVIEQNHRGSGRESAVEIGSDKRIW